MDQSIGLTISTLIPIVSLFAGIGGAIIGFLFTNAKYQQKVLHLEAAREKHSVKIDTMRTDVDTLKEFRVQAQKCIDKSIYKSSSPLSLTELGEQMVRESGFKPIFDKHKDDLLKMLEEKKPLTKYDIQEIARELMNNLGEYKPFAPIKTYAYSNGMDFNQILRAGAILLRDYYLSMHPEITK